LIEQALEARGVAGANRPAVQLLAAAGEAGGGGARFAWGEG